MLGRAVAVAVMRSGARQGRDGGKRRATAPGQRQRAAETAGGSADAHLERRCVGGEQEGDDGHRHLDGPLLRDLEVRILDDAQDVPGWVEDTRDPNALAHVLDGTMRGGAELEK